MKKYFYLAIASIVYSAGVGLFLAPNNLAPGGIVGIAIILQQLLPLGAGTYSLLLNIPILVIGFWKLGKGIMLRTAFAVAISSVATNLFSMLEPLTRQPLLAVLAGCTLTGAGIGSAFLLGGTTGGMDIVVKLLRKKYRHIKTNTIFLLLDLVVILLSATLFRDFELVIYAIIGICVVSNIMDYVLYGQDEARMFFIISQNHMEIVSQLLERLEVGVTLLKGEGAYSKEEKCVILCVVKKRQAPLVEEIIRNVDDKAFFIISSANEIYGKGYKCLQAEVL